jgi:hypothetical protein
MGFSSLVSFFPRKSLFLPKTCPSWLSPPGHGDTGILETGAKKFNIRRRPFRRSYGSTRLICGAARHR